MPAGPEAASVSVLLWASQGLPGLAHSSQAALEDLGASSGHDESMLWTSTWKLFRGYCYLPCMSVFSLTVISTFNQNEHVFSVNNANAMQTFHCLLLGVSA